MSVPESIDRFRVQFSFGMIEIPAVKVLLGSSFDKCSKFLIFSSKTKVILWYFRMWSWSLRRQSRIRYTPTKQCQWSTKFHCKSSMQQKCLCRTAVKSWYLDIYMSNSWTVVRAMASAIMRPTKNVWTPILLEHKSSKVCFSCKGVLNMCCQLGGWES